MTWQADQTEGRPQGDERAMLLLERNIIVGQIEKLKAQPMGKSNAAIQGRQTDLIELAHKIVKIDKKLGRL